MEEGQEESASADGSGYIELDQKDGVEKFVHTLVHASGCKTVNCCVADCQPMKKVRMHIKSCKQIGRHGCQVCWRLLIFCSRHAKYCQKAKCPVPFCLPLKEWNERMALKAKNKTAGSRSEVQSTS